MPIAYRRSIPAAILVVASLVVSRSGAVVRAQSASDRQGHVTVAVLGKDDVPITTLAEKDFVVREDNVSREILKVTPGVTPSHVVLLVDDSQANVNAVSFLRDGLKTFIEKVMTHAPAPQMRITTFGDRPTLRQDFTTATAMLTRQVDRVFPQTGAGSRLLDAISETCRDLKIKRIAGATLVAVVNEAGPEFSEISHTRIEEELRGASATLWTVVLQDARGGNQSSEARERSIVIGDVTRDSGGMNKNVLGAQTLGPALESVATMLVSQYAITYGRPDRLIPASRLSVETTDRGARALFRRWATP
ncbi:MAG: hypothetical protein ABI634_01065 [Acidobacteriota bacterium]